MAATSVNRSRAVVALALVVLVAALGWVLQRSPLGEPLSRTSYDSLHALAGRSRPALDDSPVAIVYLDLPTYRQANQDPIRPLPRELHANLVRRLTDAGARAVVFDIIFGQAGPNPEADAAFAEAIRENGHVVLAAEFNNKSSRITSNADARLLEFSSVPPYPLFRSAAAGWGIASQRIEDDFTVRQHLSGYTSAENPTLVWSTAKLLGLPLTHTTSGAAPAAGRWLRYYGPPLTIPHVSYVQAIDPTGVPDDFFRNKVVLVGARPVAGLFQERQDEFRSPFHSLGGADDTGNRELFLPGVEVHATELLNLMRGDWLERTGRGREMLWLLLAALGFGGGLIWLRPLPATGVALVGAGLATALAWSAFMRGVWFPWLIVAAVQIPAALFGSWLYQFQNWFFTRRRMELAKRVADAKIREQAALIGKARDAILVQDLAGKILYANPSAERLYGWSLTELQREGALFELFAPDPRGAQQARATALQMDEWNGELRQQTRRGDVVTVASRWTLLRDDAGQPTGLLFINSDITEQKQLEQQFLRTQRMNTIGTLAGGMAHDLNNALAPILMGAQLLKRRAQDDETRHMLNLMETSTQRGAEMVRQVLLFARGRGGEFERLELGPLVKELEKMVRETFPRNVTVEAFVPPDLWPVRGNLTQLHQVLLNLCVNARDAMPAGGKIAFVADNVGLAADEAAQIPSGRAGEFVSLAVSDTGTGMPPEVCARIFEPFFTTKEEGKGTGIGLATVLRIVKAHDGFLRVESEPGQGTTFEVFLPRAAAAEVAAAAVPEPELPRGNGELLLVAEDEQAIRELMAAELTAFGYRVLAAADGAEAVALFKQHEAAVKLFLTDNSMTVMSGVQAAAVLRQLRPGLPVILTSGETTVAPPANAVLLNKPFTLEELLQAVARGLK